MNQTAWSRRCSGSAACRAINSAAKFFQQPGRGPLLADVKAHATAAVDALGKRAQVEADDGLFQPATRRGDDFVGVDG